MYAQDSNYKFPGTDQPSVNRKQINKDGRNNFYITVWFYVVSGLEAKWSNLTALKSSLQPHGEHLTAQFADESVEYTKKVDQYNMSCSNVP